MNLAGMQGSAEHMTNFNSGTASAFTSLKRTSLIISQLLRLIYQSFSNIHTKYKVSDRMSNYPTPDTPIKTIGPRQRDLHGEWTDLHAQTGAQSWTEHTQKTSPSHSHTRVRASLSLFSPPCTRPRRTIPVVTVCRPRKPTRLRLPGQRRCRIYGI
jgi:hypothetical protein